MNMEWAAWVQAGTALVVASVTVWYAYLTHRLLQAQVEPSVELWIPHAGLRAKVYNTGSHDVVDVRVDVEVVVHTRGRRIAGSTPPPAEPGVEPRNGWKRLAAGAAVEVDLALDATNAVALAGVSAPGEGALTKVEPALKLHVVYHRAVDHRRFRFTRVALLVFDQEGETVQHLIDQDAFHYPSPAEERERAA